MLYDTHIRYPESWSALQGATTDIWSGITLRPRWFTLVLSVVSLVLSNNLYDRDGDGRWVQYGVHSLAHDTGVPLCEDTSRGDGYADVSLFYKKIIQQVRANP